YPQNRSLGKISGFKLPHSSFFDSPQSLLIPHFTVPTPSNNEYNRGRITGTIHFRKEGRQRKLLPHSPFL
ncbi:hypothetical protein, partial [uncultured Dialister sp.]|uniref:hypothetical protein n=1 Tax=uncultured Dialister sp. TaxID=278064 RepID=UPI002605EEAD